jgi:hypothetical protein
MKHVVARKMRDHLNKISKYGFDKVNIPCALFLFKKKKPYDTALYMGNQMDAS